MESAFVHISVDFIFSHGDKKNQIKKTLLGPVSPLRFQYDIYYVKGYRAVWKLHIKDIFLSCPAPFVLQT